MEKLTKFTAEIAETGDGGGELPMVERQKMQRTPLIGPRAGRWTYWFGKSAFVFDSPVHCDSIWTSEMQYVAAVLTDEH